MSSLPIKIQSACIILTCICASVCAETTAFVGVNIIPMNAPGTLTDHTVIVEEGRITKVGPSSSTAVPDNATRIDGAGKYLIPGLNTATNRVMGTPKPSTTKQGKTLTYTGTIKGERSSPTPPVFIWVDFGFTSNLQAGTLTNPFNNLDDALDLADPGAAILIKGDVDTTTGPNPVQIITKTLTLRAFRGTITIGQP